jgi:hypothetical protein
VTTSIVVGCVFLAVDQLLRVEELAIDTVANFIDDSRLKIGIDSTRDVFARTSLREEGHECIVSIALVSRHLAIRLDTMFQAI